MVFLEVSLERMHTNSLALMAIGLWATLAVLGELFADNQAVSQFGQRHFQRSDRRFWSCLWRFVSPMPCNDGALSTTEQPRLVAAHHHGIGSPWVALSIYGTRL